MINTTGRKILYDGKPVQVDSAVRDGTGLNINSTYASHYEANITTAADTTAGNVMVVDMGLYGKTPRIAQIIDASGNVVGADVTITDTQVTYNIIGTTAGQTWNLRVTAW